MILRTKARHVRLKTVTAFFSLVLLAPGLLVTVAVQTFAESVVYVSHRAANWDIYLFDKMNSAPRRLTDDPGRDYNAVFSPDGRQTLRCPNALLSR